MLLLDRAADLALQHAQPLTVLTLFPCARSQPEASSDPSFSSLLAFFPAKFLNLRFHRPAELLALVSFVFPDFALLNQ